MRFPVFTFKDKFFYIHKNDEKLFICSSLALKNGYYKGLEVIDADSFLYCVREVEVLRGEGRFWGYNIFFNRMVRVRPVFEKEPQKVEFEEVKCRVLKSLKEREAWKARGDYDELRVSVENAMKMTDITAAFNGKV